tara:strand:+ start:103 stop:1392 length:1290 start_codon:yes stop_codon:yes gene_type:complete
MAVTTLTPASDTSIVALTSTGSTDTAADSTNYPFGIYLTETSFISGASDQVAYTYKKLGGDVLDIELTIGNVYTAYEEAVLEYSYIVNIHQAKNVLSDLLGNTTGTFDQDGKLTSSESPLSSSLNGGDVSLKYPKFRFSYTQRTAEGISEKVGIGGTTNEYSASFETSTDTQDYDLQAVIYSASVDGGAMGAAFTGSVGDKKVTIKRIFYKTPHSMWRFYGYYGGLNTVGNLSTYGMYADDSTFEVIPPWQNKMQAMAYEDAIYTRNSHYSFELKNNILRINPIPSSGGPEKFWVQFTVQTDSWEEESDRTANVDGINNMNTLPFANIPFKNINSIGKQWIRRFALALTKEMLGQIRGKFSSVPIPGDAVTLNSSELLSQSSQEKDSLREELKTVLDELTYAKLAERDAAITDSTSKLLQNAPAGVYVG